MSISYLFHSQPEDKLQLFLTPFQNVVLCLFTGTLRSNWIMAKGIRSLTATVLARGDEPNFHFIKMKNNYLKYP